MAEVETAREDAVLTVTLNRPDVLNAFNHAMHDGLAAALEEAGADEVRAVVITGAGRGFSVGQDLTEFREAAGDIAERLRSLYHPNIRAIRALEKPVPAFINIGLVPDSGGSYFIRRLLGTARAFEWMSSGRKLGAAEAHAWGLVSEVVEGEGLARRAGELAAALAALPTRGIGMTKRLFDHAEKATLEEQLELEAQLQSEATKTADFAEGVAAFLEKRAPRFEGR